MTRTIVVTGEGSGIGKATAEALRAAGDTVIGVDVKGSDVLADLGSPEGLVEMAERVREISGGTIDGVVANAGVSARNELSTAINFFGAVGTVENLLPLLSGSVAPRVSLTASAASLHPCDEELLTAMLAGDRERAITRGAALAARGEEAGYLNYSTSKRAVARWVRLNAPTARFAGAGIGLNAVAPGVVITPMTEELFASEEGRRQMAENMPFPFNGPAEAQDIAALHAFLVSGGMNHLTGQVIFVDSGFDALTRQDTTW